MSHLLPVNGRAGLSIVVLLAALLPSACSESPSPDGLPNLPDSDSLSPLTWDRTDIPIPTYVITNSGGSLTTCHTLSTRPPPAGLVVSVSDDRRNCEIAGTPKQLPGDLANKNLNIYAGNRFGIDSVVLILAPTPAPSASPGQER
ncbi:MAG: hypothetical protein K0U66_09670 [Gammaproteobacteria bacterium]|nr:hypothetical protein [Pseudomonadota bacterium]MCH9663902.1 hypothetical protein [Gammaproteobacteria bacterium]